MVLTSKDAETPLGENDGVSEGCKQFMLVNISQQVQSKSITKWHYSRPTSADNVTGDIHMVRVVSTARPAGGRDSITTLSIHTAPSLSGGDGGSGSTPNMLY